VAHHGAGTGALTVPIYPALSIAAAVLVVALELCVFRRGLFRQRSYWLSMAIVYAFMVPVDGWLTKLSAPIVIYRDADTTGLRPVWDILAEEFVYAFALLTLVILVWDRVGGDEPQPVPDDAAGASGRRRPDDVEVRS
jgi:lycopene cyclase domain-containing protein